MLEKVIQFHTHDTLGRCFAEAIDVNPKGGMTKVAGNLDPELQSFIRSIRPDPKYQYVLMTPMGAHEFWGMNVNGDIFPEIALGHDYLKDNPQKVINELEQRYLKPHGKSMPLVPIKEFGFRTFMNALRYKHHVNKNPDIAYGDIVFVTYNRPMHRVELVVRHDRAKAREVGAEQIIVDIDNGKPRQISMGCKVPFDVCSVCGNVSKTTRDYCSHLANEMGQVREDGTVVGAINFFPRFFDLSDVFVPAAKESGVLMKVASAQTTLKEKVAGYRKFAEVNKKILPNAVSESIMKAQSCEPEIPSQFLREMPFEKLLATMAMLGMVAKPQEFQYGMLNRMGMGSLAEKLRGSNTIFPMGAAHMGPPPMIESSMYDGNIARLLSSLIPQRSGFAPHLPNRVIRITVIRKPENRMLEESSDILNKVASAYTGYRKSLRTLGQNLDSVIESDINFYYKNFFNDMVTDSLTKVASSNNISLTVPYLHNVYYNTNVEPEWDINLNNFSSARVLLGSL